MNASRTDPPGNRRLRITNPEKVLFPETGFTKGDLISYYEEIAPLILPHLESRPVTLRRFPDGADQPGFWQKRCPENHPDWFRTARIWSESSDEAVDYCLVDSRPGLVWVANLAAVELHTSLAFAQPRNTPTAVVFDLDPGRPAGISECCRVAVLLRGMLRELDLDSYPKSSGSKGIQLYVPLNVATTYEQTGEFAHAVARTLATEFPDLVTSRMPKRERTGKVLIDWSQNSEHKTTVCVYSVRARPAPSVSAPLEWPDVEAAASGQIRLPMISPDEMLERVEAGNDLFLPVLTQKQDLPRIT